MDFKDASLFWRIWHFKIGVAKNFPSLPYARMEATLLKDVKVLVDEPVGYVHGERLRIIPKGAKVRVWTISRFGHVCITDDLSEACNGYCTGVGGEDGRNPGQVEDYLTNVTVRLDG